MAYQATREVPKQYETVILERDKEARVAILTMNRPEVHNALSVKLMRDIIDTLHVAEEDDEVSAIILRAAGEHFCTGGDFTEFTGKDLLTQRWYFEIPVKVLETIIDMTKPVIGAIRGHAWAFGCAVAVGCDLAIASESADFCLPGGNVGFGCLTPIVSVYRSATRKKAFELLITARPFSAQEAYEAGMVNKVVPDAELDKEVWELAAKIGQHAPLVVQWEKQVFNTIQDMEHHKAYRYGTEAIVLNSLTADGYEGQMAFLEKRKPVWKGRKGGGVQGDKFAPEEQHP